jgi:WD40 repeat protein
MESWFNLLIQIAKPILTNLAYSGANIFLNTLQTEIQAQQIEQKKLALKSFGIQEKHIDRIQNYLNENDFIFNLDNHQATDTDNQQIAPNYSCNLSQAELILQLNQQIQENQIKRPELDKILEQWPLKLLPSQLITTKDRNSLIPLKILIAPPQRLKQKFSSITIDNQEIEQIISQYLREFLNQNYSLYHQVKPTEFLGEAWQNKHYKSEASIKSIFDVLKSEPILILETELEGQDLVFRLAYWGALQKQYFYGTIFKLPYQEIIQASIKTRALKWRETRKKLLQLGKTIEEIQYLGGSNEKHFNLLEEIEKLQTAGIDTKQLNFYYQIEQSDLDYLCRFLGICHCIIAGWITDIHYLIYKNLAPSLSDWLNSLTDNLPHSELTESLIRTTISLYQLVILSLDEPRHFSLPKLTLQLAESLIKLSHFSLAQEQLEYSFQLWLRQHQLLAIKDLENICANFTAKDWDYLISLKVCCSILEKNLIKTSLQQIVIDLTEKISNPISSNNNRETYFALDHSLTEISGQVFSVFIKQNSYQLISKSNNNNLDVWQLKPRQVSLSPSLSLKINSSKIIAIALSQNGKILASTNNTNNRSYIKIWNLETGNLEQTLFGHKQIIHSLVIHFSDRGNWLASGSHKIKLWDLKTGESFLTLFGHKQGVYCLAISPDGQTLISGSKDCTLRIWNLKNGNLLKTLTGHQGVVKVVAITPDGNTVVSGSSDRTIKVWDLKTGKILHNLTEHSAEICTLVISPDSKYLFSGSQDQTIKIWQLETGQIKQTLFGHEQAVNNLALSPNGKLLVSSSADQTIKFWQMQ